MSSEREAELDEHISARTTNQANTLSEKTRVIKGKPPSEEAEFYVAWGFETIKNNITLLNEAIRQFVTLNVALVGGSIAFLDDKLIGANFKTVTIILFFLSLITSFLGLISFKGEIDPLKASTVKRHKEATLKSKQFFLYSIEALLTIGFLTAIIGMVVHTW